MAYSLPVIVEKDEDGTYVVECPVLPGCYSQGATMDEAIKNIHEAIGLALEDPESQAILKEYNPTEISFHTVSV